MAFSKSSLPFLLGPFICELCYPRVRMDCYEKCCYQNIDYRYLIIYMYIYVYIYIYMSTLQDEPLLLTHCAHAHCLQFEHSGNGLMSHIRETSNVTINTSYFHPAH
jgi:hypothetical protein